MDKDNLIKEDDDTLTLKDLISVKEYADKHNLTYGKVLTAVKTKRIPGVLFGKTYLVSAKAKYIPSSHDLADLAKAEEKITQPVVSNLGAAIEAIENNRIEAEPVIELLGKILTQLEKLNKGFNNE